jgi:hypothetical protein
MKKTAKDPVREERIQDEAIVDAYGSAEAMSWCYYLESKLTFPFEARCIVTRLMSPLKKGETVEVRRMAPNDTCVSDMFVLTRWQAEIWPFHYLS